MGLEPSLGVLTAGVENLPKKRENLGKIDIFFVLLILSKEFLKVRK